MSKMSRKIAAIIAATMTATTMSVMNVFANPINIDTSGAGNTPFVDDDDDQTGTVSLKIEPYVGTTSGATKLATEEEDHVWSITVDNDELVWKVDRNISGGTFKLLWNPSTLRYAVYDASGEIVTFSLHTGEDANKTVTLTNKSNFAVDYVSDIDCDIEELFSVSAGDSGTIPVFTSAGSNVVTSTVSFDIDELTTEFWEENGIGDGTAPRTAVEVGTLTYTFSVPTGDDGNTVTDSGQYSAIDEPVTDTP